MSEIEEFILARVAEDEARASAALVEWDDEWQVMESNDLSDAAFALARTLNPVRVLAECATLRAIVADHAADDTAHERTIITEDPNSRVITRVTGEPACRQCIDSTQEWRVTRDWDVEPRVVAPCDTMRHLAAIWSDHPGYRADWRP